MKTSEFIKREWPMWIVMLIPLVMAILKWNEFPVKIPMHWNIDGEVDRYGGKASVFLSPGINFAVYFLLLFIPRIDPRKKNYDLFKGAYWLIRVIIAALLALLGVVTILVSLGMKLNVGLIVETATLCVFLLMGNQFSRIRPNYFVGIRTAWTLNNEEVWTKTHRLAGYIWVIGSLLMLPVVFFCPSKISSIAFFAYVAIIALVPIVYSWRIHQQITKARGTNSN